MIIHRLEGYGELMVILFSYKI